MTPHLIRRCIVCGDRGPLHTFARLKCQNRVVEWDRDRDQPGRGAHVHPRCATRLRDEKVLRRAFRITGPERVSVGVSLKELTLTFCDES